MANAVFTTQVDPRYDDLPEMHYHFPAKYLQVAEKAVGDWILYYEPRRTAGVGNAGRQAYYATARVLRIDKDQQTPDHYYARVTDYLEFSNPVPFNINGYYPESALRKEDGSTNKGKFGWAIRTIPRNEYEAILALGLAQVINITQPTLFDEPALPAIIAAEAIAEEPPTYGEVPRRKAILERPVRDAAFTKAIQSAYHSTCALTGLKLINGGGRCEIEAAHIRPVAHEGPDSLRNGIALSRTVHWMFDRGIISLQDDGKILQARGLVPEPVTRLLNPGGYAMLPQDAAAKPHPVFLRFHRERVYKGE